MPTSARIAEVVRKHTGQLSDGVFRISNGGQMRDFIEELSLCTERCVDTINPGRSAPGESMAKGAVWDERDLRRGIMHRTVLAPPGNFSVDEREYCNWLRGLGAQLRWHGSGADRLILADDAVALVRAEPRVSRSDALVITEPGLLAGYRTLFDTLWSSARSLDDGFLDDTGPDDVDRALLRLLADGATDAQVARELEISPRQVGRRIARLATELGAVGRFSLGAAAERRGWLS